VIDTGGPSLGCAFLGRVLAHEITHILQGADHHSLTGVMKAHWTNDDIARMGNKPLAFDPLDIFLIHQGLVEYFRPVKPISAAQLLERASEPYCLPRLANLSISRKLQLIALT
jgi:hypothetical protein